jgi:exodeoxyribonuclease V alpha subunit
MELSTLEEDVKQQEAVTAACGEDRIVAVNGKAGTGKTTIQRTVKEIMDEAGYNVVLCAPTGKAARRISEATNYPAFTIHKILEYPMPGEVDPKTGKALQQGLPKRHKNYPLDHHIVVCDEYAMVNREVHRNLIDALPPGGKLRAFGDVNQLRPIEQIQRNRDALSPFQELLAKFKSITLETIHRQSERSGIIENADAILRGRCPSRNEEFSIEVVNDPMQAVREFVEKTDDDYSTLDAQIITPTKKTWSGTAKLNAILQAHFRSEKDGWVPLPRFTWADDKDTQVRPGDKVIWTKNDYNLEVMNGETGIIVETTDEFGEVIIDFGDRVLHIPPEVEFIDARGEAGSYDPRKQIDLAYAITTHKAQGSEYNSIVYVLNKSSKFIQSRSNLYTGITRAKSHVHLITDLTSMTHSVSATIPLMERKKRTR